MKILLLGCGKTGSLVAEVARERGHELETLRSSDNADASGLSGKRLDSIDVVIDFTTPHCVLGNINACLDARKNMVVGTTGWYSELASVRANVELHKTGFVYGSNFSIGVNLFFDLIQSAAPALAHRYSAQIYERHHESKKDAPSGTAATMQKMLEEASGAEVEITSFREGDVVGMHELVLDSPNDSIYLCHDAKSRRGFAEGAVRAAEWISGKKGFYDFKDIWKQL
ncbi:MAG TPA: dihydrodipicolinate reductase C-terminal domain-containing protein [Terriglobales bacterium]|nr:dihydrodipicolinate reductase C-terminal domain-containing protein [Terriglobales bacterium]